MNVASTLSRVHPARKGATQEGSSMR
jgi:hypothetical protein